MMWRCGRRKPFSYHLLHTQRTAPLCLPVFAYIPFISKFLSQTRVSEVSLGLPCPPSQSPEGLLSPLISAQLFTHPRSANLVSKHPTRYLRDGAEAWWGVGREASLG